MEQFDTCKEWMADGYQIGFVKGTEGDVLTDKLACAVPVVFDPPFAPIAEKSNPTKLCQPPTPPPQLPPTPLRRRTSCTLSTRWWRKFHNQARRSCAPRTCSSRLCLLGSPTKTLPIWVLATPIWLFCDRWCSSAAITSTLEAVPKLSLPQSKLTRSQRFPFTSDATFAALHQFGIKSANELYLYTPIEKLHELFRLHQITDTDQRAIMTSYSLAQYARNIAKQNNRRRIKWIREDTLFLLCRTHTLSLLTVYTSPIITRYLLVINDEFDKF